MTTQDHTAALRERFGFWIKSTETTRVIHWNGGGCRPSSAVENALWDALAQPQQPKIDVEHLIRTVLPGGYICDPQAVADDLRRYFDAWEEPKAIAWKTTHKSVCPPITEDKAIADAWREAGYPVVELFGQPQQPAGWKPIETAPKDGSEVLLWLGAPWSKVEKARWYAPWSNWQCGTIPADPVREECHGIGQAIPTHWMPLPTPPGAHPSQQEDAEVGERVRDAIAAALGDAYDCLRVWEAWSVGTMGPDDFSLITDDEDRLEEITDAAIAAMSDSAGEGGKNG